MTYFFPLVPLSLLAWVLQTWFCPSSGQHTTRIPELKQKPHLGQSKESMQPKFEILGSVGNPGLSKYHMNFSLKDNDFQTEMAFLPRHSSDGKSALINCNEIIPNHFKRKETKQQNKSCWKCYDISMSPFFIATFHFNLILIKTDTTFLFIKLYGNATGKDSKIPRPQPLKLISHFIPTPINFKGKYFQID